MTNLLLRLAVSTGAVLLAQWASNALNLNLIHVDGLLSAVVFAVVLGLLNALVRPILLLVTCPITILTLGLFTFVVNAVVFWMTTWFVPGVQVSGFVGALAGSLVVTVCSALANRYLE